MGVVENLVSRSDNVVRGTKVRLQQRGNQPTYPGQYKNYIPRKLRVRGRETQKDLYKQLKIAQEPFRAGMRHQIRSGNHALCLTLGE